MLKDAEKPGGNEARMYASLREASSFLSKEIGWFIPVTQTTKMRGSGKAHLYPYPPVLALTGSIVDDATTLVQNTDYFFARNMWANGPYLGIELLTDGAISKWCDDDPDSVQIPCRAGLYERSESISATVQDNPQSDSQTTLKVDDGGRVSPGMCLLIGGEQELVTGWGDPTENITTLNGAVTSTQDVITLTSVAGIFIGEIIRVDFEQMRVKDKRTGSNQVYVDRGWNKTGMVTHTTSTQVDVYRTVTVERGINGTTAAQHIQNAAISRYYAPEDIAKLTIEIATLMMNKAGSNYAGRTGNEEVGTAFYNEFFPRFDLERIKQNYWIGMM